MATDQPAKTRGRFAQSVCWYQAASALSFCSCRLAKGEDLESICSAISSAAQDLPPTELDLLKAWTWRFAMQLTRKIIRVSHHLLTLLLIQLACLFLQPLCLLHAIHRQQGSWHILAAASEQVSAQ